MKRVALVAILAACGASDRDPGDDSLHLPDGVFEPVPGAGTWIVASAFDGENLWFLLQPPDAATRGLKLMKTTLDGDVLASTTPVESAGNSFGLDAAIAVTDLGIVAAWTQWDNWTEYPYTRAFDRDGVPLQATDHKVTLIENGAPITTSAHIALTATGGGTSRLAASLDDSTATAEVALVDLGIAGDPGPVTFAGMNDDGQVDRVAATTLADGSTLIAWDRVYDQCFGPHPAATVTTSVDAAANVGVVQSVRDLPERGESAPALASNGGATYVAWDSGWEGLTIALARYPNMSAPIELADQGRNAMLALADAEHGAIAWRTDGGLRVAPFSATGETITVGDLRASDLVNPQRFLLPVGLIHLAVNQYLLVWIEMDGNLLDGDETRSFATIIDFDEPASRTASPTTVAPSRLRWATRTAPCTH